MRRHAWKVAVVISLVAGLIYAVWPRPFELYTSRPFGDRKVRLSFLIPRGWQANRLETDNTFFGGEWIEFHPPDSPNWWPTFLRRILPPLDANQNSLTVGVVSKKEAQTMVEMTKAARVEELLAFDSRPIDSKSAAVFIFQRDNRASLQSTRLHLTDSFQVLPPSHH